MSNVTEVRHGRYLDGHKRKNVVQTTSGIHMCIHRVCDQFENEIIIKKNKTTTTIMEKYCADSLNDFLICEREFELKIR